MRMHCTDELAMKTDVYLNGRKIRGVTLVDDQEGWADIQAPYGARCEFTAEELELGRKIHGERYKVYVQFTVAGEVELRRVE